MAKFEKGNPGKQKGTKNKITISVKETFRMAFEELQKDDKANLIAWGKKNPTYFYQLASKLIPVEVAGSVQTISVSLKKKESDDSSGD